MPRILAATLTQFSVDLLQAGGVPAADAQAVGQSLVAANLRGHDSHGVMRIPFYLAGVQKKEVIPGVALAILKEGPGSIVADGNWGFGQVQARRLTEALIPKAQAHGIAVGTLTRCAHVGRLGEYCEQAAEAGLVSLMMVNTHGASRRVAPPGGTAPRLGTNPLAIGVPHEQAPLVLDFGTSATAEGKVRVKKIAGELCPDGWLLDSQGRPTRDPNALYADPPGSILPMGGDQAYKGFGLAVMVEIFCGALSGGVCVDETLTATLGNCVYLQLVSPDRLGGGEHFRGSVERLVHYLKATPRMPNCDQIRLPGDPERETLLARAAGGIPLDAGNWDQLLQLAGKLNVPVPLV